MVYGTKPVLTNDCNNNDCFGEFGEVLQNTPHHESKNMPL